MKRHTCLSRLLPLALAAALLTVPAAAGFRDTSGHWAEQTLNDWQAQGFLDGYADGTCQPDGPVTRAGFAKLMNRAMGFTAEAPITFTDVGEDDWFHAEVARAVAAGYAQGSGGAFLPRQNITRAQAAAMLARAAGLTANETAADAFTDAASLPAWAKGSIGAAAAAGLMSGYADGTFRADGLITRAQAVVTLDRLMKYMQDKDKTPDSEKTTTPSSSGGSSGGGSSSGSSSAVWTVTGAEAVPDVTVDYGTSEADAMGRLPGTVTLNAVKRGRTGTVSAQVSWALDTAYDANPSADTVYTAIGTVTLPSGYTYSGALTVTAKLTVKGDPDKTVVNILDVAGLELPYGAAKSAARLPALVTVETETGGTLLAEVTSWTLNGTWASPGVNTYTGTVAMPSGYAWNGQTTASITAAVTVVEDGVTPEKKLVVNYIHLAPISISYAGTEELVLEAARAKLPKVVTLQCEDNSFITVTVPADAWRLRDTPYDPTPNDAKTVSLKADAALPAGYDDHNGTTPVSCSVQVKALDTAALEDALDEAKVLVNDRLTVFEADAFKDPAKIYVATNSMHAGDITSGVKFVWDWQAALLRTAYNSAESKSIDSFTSQAECDSMAKGLLDEAAALKAAVQTGTNKTTNAYLLRAVQTQLLSTERGWYAYSPGQLLKKGSAYPLHIGTWTADGGTTVEIVWEAQGAGAQYVEIKSENDTIGYYERDGIRYGTSHGALITDAPSEPKKVQFVATVKDYYGTVIGKLGENGEYTATIGAPIRFSDQQPSAPLFASGYDATGEIYLNLVGAGAITDVDTGKIGIVPDNSETGKSGNNYQQIDSPEIKSGTKSVNGVCLDVSIRTPQLGEAQKFPLAPSTGSDENLKHSIGVVDVTIKPGALTLDESTGWYFPEAGLRQKVNIWLVNPQMDVTTHFVDADHRNISVRTKYIGEVPVQVAFTKTDDPLDANYRGDNGFKDDNVRIWVEIPYEQSEAGTDGERIYSVDDVAGFGEAGDYYIWCRAWEGATGAWLYTNSHFTVDGQDTNEGGGQDTE